MNNGFGKKEIAHLGDMVSINGVQPDKDTISTIQQWPTPTTVKELRGFLGLSGCYKWFVSRLELTNLCVLQLMPSHSHCRHHYHWLQVLFSFFQFPFIQHQSTP